MKKTLIMIFVLIITMSLGGCVLMMDGTEGNSTQKPRYLHIWQDTPAWELAVAVRKQDANKIEQIVKEKPELLNYQEPTFDITLLIWAVGVEKYKSAETLLKCGADPNVVANGIERYKTMVEKALSMEYGFDWLSNSPKPFLGSTALSIASGYSWLDNQYKKDPKYVKLLLQYGADPNIYYIGAEPVIFPAPESAKGSWRNDYTTYYYGSEIGDSPLMNSIGCGIEKTKALVEAGADINHKNETGRTAATVALLAGGVNVTEKEMEYAHYLIAEKKTNVTEPYIRGKTMAMHDQDPNDELYPVNILRNWIPKLNSEGYKMKLEIVEEFARQGVDYWTTEIPKDRLEQIQKLYPDTWKEYIQKY